MNTCPGSGQLPASVNSISFSGSCKACGVRFERAKLTPLITVSPQVNGATIDFDKYSLIPAHSLGSHHQEL